MGTAVDAQALASNATYAGLLGAEFDLVVPENATKWEVAVGRPLQKTQIARMVAG